VTPALADLRAGLFLHAVIPLLDVVVAERGLPRWLFARTRAAVQFEVAGGDAVHLELDHGAGSAHRGRHPSPDVTLAFADAPALNRFLSGRGGFPSVRGLFPRPVLAAKVLALLGALRLMQPELRLSDAADRALRVKLLLFMATRGLSQLNRMGHPGVRRFAEASPERVYQWTVRENGTAAYLRVSGGRTRAGRGAYAHRAPFVHFVFPTVDAADRVLTRAAGPMEAVERGWIATEGSPEYSRSIGRLLQEMDNILQGAES